MLHIDLFSGIGGFAYAARKVWGDDYRNAFFCEINKFCQAVLKKNFGKDILIYDDIKTVTRERYASDLLSRNAQSGHVPASRSGQCTLKGREAEGTSLDCRCRNSGIMQAVKHKNIRGNEDETKERSIADSVSHGHQERYQDGRPEIGQGEKGRLRQPTREDCHVDIITAGVPCQPASCAGKRGGSKDPRWLWPETFRVIREFRPAWCLLENVYGLVSLERGLVFESLCAELEAIGYEVAPPFIIPACGVNAPHRRYRVWIVCHAKRTGLPERTQEDKARIQLPEREDCIISDPAIKGCERYGGKHELPESKGQMQTCSANCNVADTKTEGLEREYAKGNPCAGRRASEHDIHAPNTVILAGRAEPEIESGRQARTPAREHRGIDERNTWDRERIGVAQETCGEITGRETNQTETDDEGKPVSKVVGRISLNAIFHGVDDGATVRMDSLNLTAAGHRVERLKALGNAIVPQVAVEIFKAIKHADEQARDERTK